MVIITNHIHLSVSLTLNSRRCVFILHPTPCSKLLVSQKWQPSSGTGYLVNFHARFYRWTRQRTHNTLIAVDRYLRRMGYKTIHRRGSRYRSTTSRCSGLLLSHMSDFVMLSINLSMLTTNMSICTITQEMPPTLGPRCNIRTVVRVMGCRIQMIRLSWDCLILIMVSQYFILKRPE